MIIRRIGLRNYRGVERRDIELEAGVNIVEGPNEAGKTSLAEALWLVFEYPDSSTHRSVVATHPVHRDEGPEIDIALESGAYEFSYHKRYKRRPETTLQVRRPQRESLTGREAHARAQQILDETIDVALWRALQLQQGLAIEQADLRDREALSRALDAASGPGSEGDGNGDERGALFERVHGEYLRYYTEKGRIRADRAELREELEEASAQLAELEARERASAGEVVEAERLGASLRDLRSGLPELESRANQLASEWAAVVRRREESERATRDAEAARLRTNAAKQAQQQRQQLAEDAEAAAARRAELEKRIEAEDGPLRRAELRWRELRERESQARSELEACEARFQAAETAREIARNELELRRMLERIARADQLERDLQAALESAKAVRVDDAGLAALQEAELDVRQTRARLEESGARVELRALDAAELLVTSGGNAAKQEGAMQLEAGETRHYSVDETLTLSVPGSLEITIIDNLGVASDESPRAAAARASQHRDRLWRELAVESLGDAARAKEEGERARQMAQWTRRELEQTLDGASPSELRAEATALRETLSRMQEQSPPNAETPEGGSAEPCSDLLQVASQERDRARAAFEQATALAENERERRENLRLEGMRLAGGIETAIAQAEALSSRLESLRAETPDGVLAEGAVEAARELSNSDSRAARLRDEVAALDAERLETLHTNAEEVVGAARREEQAQSVALASVAARLEAQQEAGLFEELERTRARRSALEREHEANERRARAASRLYLEMSHQRDLARKQYLQPLRERIERLGRIVFGPTFSVALDSALRIESRTLEGRTVEFESLSTGAQEQIGLLTRLAVAMTVAPEGGVPLVLDDALGNSDPLRLQSMGAMLAQAGRECQIIVLTCSPERFRHVGGAHVQRIATSDSPGSAQ